MGRKEIKREENGEKRDKCKGPHTLGNICCPTCCSKMLLSVVTMLPWCNMLATCCRE